MINYTKLHDVATVIGFSKPLDVSSNESIGIQVSGTSTSFTVEFYGSIDGVEYGLVQVSPMADFSTFVTSTTAKGLFQLDVEPLKFVKTKISAIGNGNLTVTASVFAG